MDAPVLRGEHLVLRGLVATDAEAWKAGEDPEQIRWFAAPGPAPMANVVASIEAWQAGWRDGGSVRQWGIEVAGVLAGGVELRLRSAERADVSYVVFPTYRGRGVATEAVRLAVAWAGAHLGVVTVVAVVDERNVASRAVVERAGFVLDGPADPDEHTEPGPMLRFVCCASGTADATLGR